MCMCVLCQHPLRTSSNTPPPPLPISRLHTQTEDAHIGQKRPTSNSRSFSLSILIPANLSTHIRSSLLPFQATPQQGCLIPFKCQPAVLIGIIILKGRRDGLLMLSGRLTARASFTVTKLPCKGSQLPWQDVDGGLRWTTEAVCFCH